MLRISIFLVGIIPFVFCKAAELWYVNSDQVLLAAPRHGANVVGHLPSQSRVSWLERKAGYVRVRSDESEGWILIFSLRSGAKDRSNAFEELNGIASLPLRETEPTRIVASVGVRGVMEEALRSNHILLEEVIKLEVLAHRSREMPMEKIWESFATFNVDHLPLRDSAQKGISYEP